MAIERFSRGMRALACTGACLLVLAAPAAAQEEEQEGDAAPPITPAADLWELPEPDTSRWRCRQCPFPSGWSGTADVGIGHVSDESEEFGDFRGLDEDGVFPVLGGELRYRGEDGAWARASADGLGVDSRSVRVEGGRQGSYELRLGYDQLPHFLDGDHRTVFSGAESSTLSLPGGWVRGSDTGAMTQLDSSLHDESIGWERDTLDLGVGLHQGDHLRYDVDYRKSTREGDTTRGGSFLFRSAILPAPVDYETEQLDASVAYVQRRWQLEAAYHWSGFTNANDALIWDNPYTSGSNADQGRMGLPPDNEFNQVMLSGSWRSRDSLTVAGRVAMGRMKQNEAFLPSTINSSLSAPALPRDDLAGEVDTRTANLRITGEPAERLTAQAELYYDERDNDTPRDSYTQVTTDELVNGTRTNRPYGYEKSGGEATLDYRASGAITLSGSAERERFERTFQEVEETTTDTLWGELRATPSERVQVRFRRTREQRDGSYEQLSLAPPENPDMRKFHIAERTRDLTRMAFDYLAGGGTTVGFSIELAEDDYTESEVGLTEAEDKTYTFDFSTTPAEGVTAYGFLALQTVSSRIDGADNVTGAPWSYRQEDRYDSFGFGLELADLPGGFTRGGLDLTFGQAHTDIDVDKAVTAPELPTLKTYLRTVALYADRPLSQNADLRLGYLLESYDEKDFQRDRVDPDTIPTVLTLGEGTPSYNVHVLRASLRYRF